jgi:hypothetical protein
MTTVVSPNVVRHCACAVMHCFHKFVSAEFFLFYTAIPLPDVIKIGTRKRNCEKQLKNMPFDDVYFMQFGNVP